MENKQRVLELENDYNKKTVWTRLLICFFGIWLIFAPLTFDYGKTELVWSDALAGIFVLILGLYTLKKMKHGIQWTLFAIGLWLQFAPLIFWAPKAVTYLNDTLIGLLIIALSIVIPTRDELLLQPNEEIPPGWSYNPSSWVQRMPIVIFGMIGWFISRYLAAYQLGYIDHVWDPFFGSGTLKVITSPLSKSFPISDAGLGAVAYSLETILALKGGPSRWRTMPWMVVFFAILVIPLGFASTLLIMLQPIVVGFWCGLCLIAAFCMLIMMALSIDEAAAVIQFLKHTKLPFWQTFWHGGEARGSETDFRTPDLTSKKKDLAHAMFWGVSIPWNLALVTLVGIWQLFAAGILGVSGKVEALNHICGALAVVFSVLSWAEVSRKIRYANFLVAALLIANLLFLSGHTQKEIVNNLIVATLLVILSWRRGPIYECYGALPQTPPKGPAPL